MNEMMHVLECPGGFAPSVLLIMSYDKKDGYIWFMGGDLNSYRDSERSWACLGTPLGASLSV